MALRLAIIGLDPIQQDWIQAVRALADKQQVELVAAGHRSTSPARDLGDALGLPAAATFDDLRKLLLDASPQIILLDRPENAGLDFLTSCITQKIGLFCLGPPVTTVAEAAKLAETLEPKTALLYVWPRLANTPAYRHCAEADQFVKPVRFATAQWFALSHPLARTSGQNVQAVRSMTVLAWDAIGTLIDLLGMPESIFATLRGTVGKGDSFADLTGAAALTLRFADQCPVNLTISDRVGPWQREILLWGQSGSLRLNELQYRFTDADAKLIDEGSTPPPAAPPGPPPGNPPGPLFDYAGGIGLENALEELGLFLEHFTAQPSPHRGWEHRMVEIASVLEAMVVSHRTGQAENPEKFLALRR